VGDGAFDVVVIGGGPAGASAALALARAGRSVAVLERSRYEPPRVGETLPPVVCLPLARLGLWDEFRAAGHARSPGIVSAWGADEPYENDFVFNPFGPGWHVDRAPFDAALAAAAEAAGAHVWRGTTPRSCRRQADGLWRVEVEGAGGSAGPVLVSRWAVDATGRPAWLARRLGVRRAFDDDLVGTVAFGLAARSVDARTYLEARPGGWWYAARLPDGSAVAAYMTDPDGLPRSRDALEPFWRAELGRTRLTAALVEAGDRPLALRTVEARSARLERADGPGWLAVGDAACSFDPLSSRGISKGLETGLAAADAILAALGGDRDAPARYADQVERTYTDYLRTRSHYYSLERRWPASPFWSRRAGPVGAGRRA
jgi:flavin-dependent dehydrogenase